MKNNETDATPQHPLQEWAAAGWQQLSTTEAAAARQRLSRRVKAQRSPQRNWGKWMAIAASVTLLLAVGQYFLTTPNISTPLASRSIISVDAPLPTGALSPKRLANSSHLPDLLAQGKAAYQAGQFAKAVPLFERYLAQDEDHHEVRLFLGHAQLQTDPFAAKRTLWRVLRVGGLAQASRDYADCFFAIAQLKTGEEKIGKQTLATIAADNAHPLQNAAANVLQQYKD